MDRAAALDIPAGYPEWDGPPRFTGASTGSSVEGISRPRIRTDGDVCRRARRACKVLPIDEETDMPKGVQRSNKMVKKPKKDGTPAKELSAVSPRPTPPATLVMPKGKMKNKPA
jgi:hypothetical protein